MLARAGSDCFLHGYGGIHRKWLEIKTELPEIASMYDMIVVCPDGATAWYWDSNYSDNMTNII